MNITTRLAAFILFPFFAGVCFSDDTAFIAMTGDCKYPSAATEGTTIALTWLVTEVRPASVYFQLSSDEGNSWSVARKISNANGDCQPPSVAINSGIMHLAWVDCGEVIEGELYYTRSTNGGASWEKNRVLLGNVNSAQYPLISCKGNDVYLIWQDVGTRIYFKVSHDQGRTWEKETLIGAVGKQSCYCFPPALSANGNGLTVVWTNFKGDKQGASSRATKGGKRVSSIICRKSSDNGRTWGKERTLTSNKIPVEMKDEIDNPTMFSDGSRAYLFWQDKHELALGEILYTVFDPAAKIRRIAGKPLCPTPKRSPKCPSAVFDDKKNIHFTWATFFGNESIVHYGALDPAGRFLNEKTDLTSTSANYQNPTLLRTASGILNVFWFNKSKNKNEPARIFLKTSSDNGTTWQFREPRAAAGPAE